MKRWFRPRRAFRIALFTRDLRRDIREEIRFYLEERTKEFEAQGMSPSDAWRAALNAFGDVNGIESRTAEASLRMSRREGRRERMSTLFQDLKIAARGISMRPGFAAMVILTLAVGIGANTAIFTVVNAVLLRPLPYAHPEQLVMVWESTPTRTTRSAAPANFVDARAQNTTFEDMAGFRTRARNLLGSGEPERVVTGNVSANFFETLGVAAARGTTFTRDVVRPGEHRNVVLAHDFWTRRFGADPEVLGRTLQLDSERVTVIGVMPEGFDFPTDASLWMKAAHDVPEFGGGLDGGSDHSTVRDSWYFRVVGRLQDGVSLEQAQADMDGIALGIQEIDPESNAETSYTLIPLHENTVASTRTTLLVLLGAVAFVLLIACTNVANLVLVRSQGRSRELAVRAALGAGRGRLTRLILTESGLLGAAGGAAGVMLAVWLVGLIKTVAPDGLPRLGEVSVDGVVLSFGLGISFLTVLLFGAIPALSAASTNPHTAMSGRGAAEVGGSRRWTRHGLVVAEMALAVILVLGAGLMLRSVWEQSRVELGFDARDLALMPFTLPGSREMEHAEWQETYARIEAGASQIPGIEAVGLATRGPMSTGWQAGLRVEGREFDTNNPPVVGWQVVSASYFAAVGTDIVRGRGFNHEDVARAPRAAVINETLATQIFPDEDPIGRRINTGLDGMGNWVTVVGVVRDTRNQGPVRPTRAAYFRPLTQPSDFAGDGMMLTVRSSGRVRDRIAPIQQAVWNVDANIPFYRISVEEELYAGFTAGTRFVLGLLGAFAGVAILLGSIGIYGVTAYTVSRRTREIGVRVAMGAQSHEVTAMVLRQGLGLALLGVIVGLGAAAALGRTLQSLLFEVSPTDPATFVAVAVLLLLVGLLATLIPARRAGRVDPMTAIRSDG